MRALKIEELRGFTTKLVVRDTFDGLCVREARVATFSSFSIDGRIRPGYYTKDEREAEGIREYASWRMLRPFCFSLIKGKRLPGSFHIDFSLGPEATAAFAEETGGNWRPEMVKGLYLGVRYENGELWCVTGLSLEGFTMDRSLEYRWDEAVKTFLRKNEIAFAEQ